MSYPPAVHIPMAILHSEVQIQSDILFLQAMNFPPTCCAYANGSVTLTGPAPLPGCSPLPTDVDLFTLLYNDSQQLDHWYGECFGPSIAPAITWQELLPPLVVYG